MRSDHLEVSISARMSAQSLPCTEMSVIFTLALGKNSSATFLHSVTKSLVAPRRKICRLRLELSSRYLTSSAGTSLKFGIARLDLVEQRHRLADVLHLERGRRQAVLELDHRLHFRVLVPEAISKSSTARRRASG